MSVVKTHRFPVSVEWCDGRLTRASAPGKPELKIATPPEFKGGVAGIWSPEDLLVAATASCYTVTLLAVAERQGLVLHALEIDGTGYVTRRDDGRFGFVAIELHAVVETDEEIVDAVEDATRAVKELCLVSIALDTPVHVEVEVRVSSRAASKKERAVA